MKILVLLAAGLVAINIGDEICALKGINLLVLQVSHVVFEREVNKKVTFLTIFHAYFAHFDQF